MTRKYYTPMATDLYKAPRRVFDYMDQRFMGTTPEGSDLLSTINARIDVQMANNKIGEAQALTIFNLARRTLAETIQLN